MNIGEPVNGVFRDSTGCDSRRLGTVASKPNKLGFFWVRFEDEAGYVLQMCHTIEASHPGQDTLPRSKVFGEVMGRIRAMVALVRMKQQDKE